MSNIYVDTFREAILDTDRDRALLAVEDALASGMSPEDLVFQVVMPTIDRMVRVFNEEELSLAQHFMTAQISAEVVERMIPRFARRPEMVGRMVLGTAHADFHGLGKRVVGGCLSAQMIEVVDLGLNVAPERFVHQALEQGAQVIGISSMMVHTARGEKGCLAVRRILQERGLEKKIKIVVGGAPYRFDPDLYRIVGADAWAGTAVEAAPVVRRLIQEVRES